MRLPRHFAITITGDTHAVLVRHNIDEGRQLGYLLGRLFAGESVAESAFEPLGVTVERITEESS